MHSVTSGGACGFTQYESTNWVSDSSIVIQVPSGFKISRRLTITALAQPGSASFSITYDVPKISSCALSNLAIHPVRDFSISGDGFAVKATTLFARTGHSDAEKSVWFSQTALICRISASLRGSQMVALTTGAQPGTLTSISSFDAPALSSAQKSNSPTTGSVSMSIYGGVFGITTFSPIFRMGHTSAENTRWVSSTTVRAIAVSGSWASIHVAISVGEQANSLSRSLSYHLPTLVVSAPGNKATTGSRSITMSGAGFGILGMTALTKSGLTSSENTEWVSDTSITQRLAAGVSSSLLNVITAGMSVGSATSAHSFDVPILTLQQPAGQVDINVVFGGEGYVPGTMLLNSQRGGYGFEAAFSVAGGSIDEVHIVQSGSDFTEDPDLGISYKGTNTSQENTITDAIVESSGRDYIAGDLMATSISGGGFKANFSVQSGAVDVISILQHGQLYKDTPILSLVYSGTSQEMSNSIRAIRTISSGHNYIDGTLLAIGLGQSFAGTYETTPSGAINSTSVSHHGSGIISDPTIEPFYTGTTTPMTNSITSLVIGSPGSGYISGAFKAVNASGTGFEGTFTVDRDGKIITTHISNHGRAFDSRPDLLILYPGSTEKISGSITGVKILHQGMNFDSHPGKALLTGNSGAGFEANVYTVNGKISEIDVLNHGADYNSDPALQDIKVYYGYPSSCGAQVQSSTCLQESSITHVEVMRYGNGHYASGPVSVICTAPCVGIGFAAECRDLPVPPSTVGDGIIDQVLVLNHGTGYDAQYPPTLACPSDSSAEGGLGQLFVPKVAVGVQLQAVRAHGALVSANRASGASLAPVRPNGAVVKAQRAFGATFNVLRNQATGIVSAITTVTGGSGYLNGDIRPLHRIDSQLSANFTMKRGVINDVIISNYGSNYSVVRDGCCTPVDPLVKLHYHDGNGLQENSVTSVDVLASGSGYTAGDVVVACLAPCTGTGFRANYSVGLSGEITKVTILDHGIGYTAMHLPLLQGGLGSNAVLRPLVATGAIVLPHQRINAVNRPPKDESRVLIMGQNFGIHEYSIKAVVQTACESTMWVSDTFIVAKTASGVQKTRSIALSMGERVGGTFSESFSFDGVSVRAIFVNVPATGSIFFTIRGRNYGMKPYTSAARIDGTNCRRTDWMSDSSILCQAPTGIQGTRPMTVSVSQVGTMTETLSFDVPQVSTFSGGANAPATGSKIITLVGQDFGHTEFSSDDREGFTSSENTLWQSDSSLSSIVAAGAFSALPTSVTIGIRLNTLTTVFSYDLVTPKSVLDAKSNGPVTGAVSLTVIGLNFAHFDYTGRLRLGHTACQTTVWVAESTLTCMESSGLWNTQHFILSLGRLHSTFSKSFTYDRPSLSAVALVNQLTQTARTLTVFGSGFSERSFSGGLRVGHTATESTKWISETNILSLISAGVKGSLQVVFTSAVASSGTKTQAISYNAPIVSSVSPSNTRAMGMMSITIFGSKFGEVDFTPAARVAGFGTTSEHHATHLGGGTGCEATVWKSSTSAVCKTPRGLLFPKPLAITVGLSISTTTRLFTFDSPRAVAILYPNGPLFGGVISTILGENFGWLDLSPQTRIGGTSCESSQWLSDSSVHCKVIPGYGLAIDMALTVEAMLSTIFGGFSYDQATIQSTQHQNVPSTGAVSVSIFGFNFGVSTWYVTPVARMGMSACENSLWLADSSILCSVAAGATGDMLFTITIERRSASTTTLLLSYDAPAPQQLILANVGRQTQFSILLGSNFGVYDTSGHLRVGISNAETTLWGSETSVALRASTGCSASQLVVMTSSNRMGSSTQILSYDNPSISSAHPTNTRALGHTQVSIFGGMFGQVDFTPAARVAGFGTTSEHHATHLGGGTGCEATVWKSSTSAVCKTPRGLLFPKPLAITVGLSISTTTRLFTFDSPRAVAILYPNRPSFGGMISTILGENFGWLDLSPQTRIGGTSCESSQWLSDSSVLSMVPNGFNVEITATVTLDRKVASVWRSFTYDQPLISAVMPSNLPTLGAQSILMNTTSLLITIGQNFGARGSSPLLRVEGTECESTIWLSVSSITSKISSGVASYSFGHVPSLSLTCAHRISTVSSLFTYNRPRVTRLSRSNAPASGGVQVVMSGINFGKSDYTPIAYVDYHSCAATTWASDSSLICKLPEGYGSGKGVAVQVGNDFGSPFYDDFTFAFDEQNVLMSYGIPNPSHESLLVWLNAGNFVLENGGSVTSWPDNSQHSTSIAATNAPKWYDRILNDQPVVRFNASLMQSLTLTSDRSSVLAQVFGGGNVLSKTYTAFVVLRFTGAGDGRQFSIFSASNGASQDDYFNFAVNGMDSFAEYRIQTVINANAVFAADRKMTADESFAILALVHDGFAVYLYKDGTVNPMIQQHDLESAEGTPPYVRPVRNDEIDGTIGVIDSVRVGAIQLRSNVSQFFQGDIAEVLVYDTNLATVDIDRMGSYLSRKYTLLWQVTTGPKVTAISPCNGPAKGGTLVTIFGSQFSDESSRIRAQVKGTNCTDIVLLSLSSFKMIMPPGVGMVDVKITADEVSKIVHSLFQFDHPVVTALKPSTAPSIGGLVVTVLGENFGSRDDYSEARVSAQDGDVGCILTSFVSDSSIECITPRKFISDGNIVVSVGQQLSVKSKESAIRFVDIPSYFRCNLGAECADCCQSRCELEEMRKDQATGRTHVECRKICVEYCGNSLRKAVAPTLLRVGPTTPTGSTIPLVWEAPLDSGGARVISYAISYTIKGEVERVVETTNEETQYLISGLMAETDVNGIKVQAITKFGYGAASDSLETFTSKISTPSQARSFAISGVGRTSLLLTWELPEDRGGELAVRMQLEYFVSGSSFEINLGQDVTSYHITGLSGSTLVSGILLTGQNSAGAGLSSGPLESQSLSSNAPSISSVADTKTLVGESTAPQSFYVSDEETEVSQLRIRAQSSNEHLVPASGIAIGGVSRHRFVIVTPVPGTVGAAQITITVQDSDSLTAQMAFLVTVESAWQLMWPTSGLASGGAQITISGGGFVHDDERQYNCVFTGASEIESTNTVASVESSSKLVCIAPVWLYPGQVTEFSLTKGGQIVIASAVGEKGLDQFYFVFTEAWSAMSPKEALAIGGTMVTLSGAGFDVFSTKYTCLLAYGDILMASTSSKPTDSLTLVFILPAWGLQHAANSVTVYLRNDGVLVPRVLPSLQTIQFSESWAGVSYLANQLKTTVSSEGGSTITVHGNGFDTSKTIQYQCFFTEQCCQRPPCAPSDCISLPSLGVYAHSSTRIECEFPAWGTLYPYSGAYVQQSVYTTLTLTNTHRQQEVLFTGHNGFEYEFQELFKNVFPKTMPITGGSITIFGSGFDSDCEKSGRGCYLCVFSASESTTLYGAGKPCADSSCKGALSVPTSTKEVTCAFPNWGASNSAGQIMVTLVHESGHLVSHVSETSSGGNVADKFLLTEESWISFQPRAAYLISTTEITVVGAGFETFSQYSCAVRSVPVFSRDCISASDCTDVSEEACATSVNCINSKCIQEVSHAVKQTAQSLFTIVCSINATQWGSCFPAATTQVVVRRLQGLTEIPVTFDGAADADKLVYAESWVSISPTAGDKFGFTDTIIEGMGFDVKERYTVKFAYQLTSLSAEPVFPASPSRIIFKAPNWASRSGLGGRGALTTVTLLHGKVVVFSQTVHTYEFLES